MLEKDVKSHVWLTLLITTAKQVMQISLQRAGAESVKYVGRARAKVRQVRQSFQAIHLLAHPMI